MPRRSLVLLIFFFFSGAAALAYEIVWIRQLSLTLSITVYALTTVLTAFMAGLAIGSAVSARIADRVARPMMGFGLIEIGIGVCGLLTPFVLNEVLPPVFIAIHNAFGGEGVVFGGVRFLLAFLVLLVPTTLMGITLPLLSRAIIDKEDTVGLGAGALYAANTLGAVTGCVLAGFVLIPQLGLWATSATAATVNLSIGALAFAIGREQRVDIPERVREDVAVRPAPIVVLVALAYALSGFTAMGYEILWTRALEHYTHNSTYAYTAILATFLLGLGAGSALIARFADRFGNPVLTIAVVQVAIGLSVVAALGVYQNFEGLIPVIARAEGGVTSFSNAVTLIFTEASLVLLVTTLLLGAMFPLVTRVAVDSLRTMGRRIGIVYLLNTIGSILGSLLVGFFVLPALGMRNSFLLLLLMNLALGTALALRGAKAVAGASVGVIAGVAAVAAFLFVPPDFFLQQFRARFHKILFFQEEVTDTVMVTEEKNGSRMIRYSDGRGTAGTGTVIGDRMYGHLPLLLHPDPKTVLQIAFGVGNSLSSVLQHPVEHVDCVELSPGVIQAAKYFEESNRDSLEDPRVTLHVTDGRNYLLTSPDEYDIIRLDPPELHTRGVVNLYTREFYESARDHLAPGGIFSIWVNIAMTPEEDMRHLVRTVLDVFPYVTVWQDPGAFSWIINGSMEPRPPDMALLKEKFADGKIREDLASIGLADPYELLTMFVFGNEGAEEFAGTGPLVVDDQTILDFSVPRSQDSYFGMANLNNNFWLLAEEGRLSGAQFAAFLRKVALMGSHRRPVGPEVVHLGDMTPDELDEEVDRANERRMESAKVGAEQRKLERERMKRLQRQ